MSVITRFHSIQLVQFLLLLTSICADVEEQEEPFYVKCCEFNFANYPCSGNETIVYNVTVNSKMIVDHIVVREFKVCDELVKLDDNEWFLQPNGILAHPNMKEFRSFTNPGQYCLWHDAGSGKTEAFLCFKSEEPEAANVISIQRVYHRIDEDDVEENPTSYSIGMMISLPFLLMTLLVYGCVSELQNLHGKSLMCYVATLFIAYIFLISIQLYKTSGPYCIIAPFIVYFSFLVSFLWLNVMSIDIWWTFSGRRGFKGSVKQSERKRFLVYSLYAWGLPLLMLVTTIVLQFAPHIPKNMSPNFGVGKCWFPDDFTIGVFFYGPILLVILSNLVLFGYTTYKIWRVQRDTDLSMKHDSKRHQAGDDTDKQRYKLYLKLMLVFGLNWLTEIISWLIGGPIWWWYITDMCNALYGVFIFFIFVCKANVWKLVKKRYHLMMGRPYLAQTYGPSSSTRSTGMTCTTPGPNQCADTFALNATTTSTT